MTGRDTTTGTPALSVVLCTFNRAPLLARALDALITQAPDTPAYEVVVVDNNSTDATREIVAAFAASGIVRYAFESEQGLSAARNSGIRAALAPLLAFTDDDVCVESTWVGTIVGRFQAERDLDMLGGPVEPQWEAPPPAWLRDAGLAPLAVVDYGNEPFRITLDRQLCLVGANLAVRRDVFDRVGGFSEALQRVGGGIGSTEDQELELRVLSAGGTALYEPRMRVRAQVPRGRLSKRYHREWHTGHGRFYAIMRDPRFERSQLGTLLGVPAHVYRSALGELAAWARATVSFRTSAAFAHELRLRFLMSYARQRIFGRSYAHE